MWSDENSEWELEEELGFEFSNRVLAKDESDYGDEDAIYKHLRIAIVTLYLILSVEFVRYAIDHAARGRPFFTAVLMMVYSELATLGIVEFGLFLWGKYGYIDKEWKKKFADVHFALFLTAIFNALQYSLTSIVSTRFSNRSWVKTEQLELDHYVEIREEYERVEEIIDLQYTGCGKWVRNLILLFCRPGLRRRHESLRVQVRFHELRLHFLESNNLPPTLKVSDYLKRSELSILIGLVHVSVATWVLLIGILNLGYFILGMIGYTTSNPGSVTTLVVPLYFVIDVFFIVLSLALRWKMNQIFQTVMKRKVIDTSNREEGIKNQQQLFWFGSPSLVIYMIQLMNFGYAISVSIVLIYWDSLNTTLHAEIFLVVSIGCYFIFLYNVSALLPAYTLCTSLGYLTNKKELQETVATHRLEEAKRQQRKKIIENAIANDSSILQSNSAEKRSSAPQSTKIETPNHTSSVSKSSIDGALLGSMDRKTPLLVSDLVKIDTKALRRNLPEESRENLINREERIRQRRLNRKKAVSDGVAAMRAWNQGSGTVMSKDMKEISKRNPTRRSRIRKTTSQPGVIQSWRNITLSEEQGSQPQSLDDIDAAKISKEKSRRKSSSDPRTIKAWQESFPPGKGKMSCEITFDSDVEGPTVQRKDAEKYEGYEDSVPQWKKDRLQRLAARKRTRKKSKSASAIIQSWQDHSTRESIPENSEDVSDENYNSSDLRALSSDDGSDENGLPLNKKMNILRGEKTGNQIYSVKHQLSLRTLREIEDDDQYSGFRDDTRAISDEKSILDLSNIHVLEVGKDRKDNDENTIDTGKSIGNLSDIDVIQAESVGIASHRNQNLYTTESGMPWYAKVTREVKLYFIGSIYPNASHVVGTSVVFFLIGFRVEVMLTRAAVANFEKGSLVEIMFWSEAMFFLSFIIADIIILVLFPIGKCKSETERQLGLATIFDLFIVGMVLTFFFVAEAQRCCIKNSDGISSGNQYELDYQVGEDNLLESACTCPRWGRRTYGGLGMIEPFTSLIFLRLFRFQCAHFLVNIVMRKKNNNESIDGFHPNTHTREGKNCHGHDNDRKNISGSALELWEDAVAKFPDVVEKYGQFSGELLQAMLGLEVVKSSGATAFVHMGNPETDQNKVKALNEHENVKSGIKLSQSRYAKLPPKAQGIVIAGSLRKPVKPIHPTLYEKAGTKAPLASLPSTGLVDFQIDHERMHFEHNASYTFVAPFARLVRSMRRCDRRHLPLLKGWLSVDVVMTQFEIVYFEAIDDYNYDLDEDTRLHFEACRLALNATKGGKNLRLCDVALGRKVVGHLDFADVIEVHVAKDDAPISDMTLVERAAVKFNKEQDLGVEYWSNTCPETKTEASQKYARIIRWTLIKEERLKIYTKSGTLFFRFYSDLEYFEAKNSEDAPKTSEVIVRDITFQWAETICRICGRSQLSQNLPHFGEGNEAELRDYLEIIHFHEKEAQNEKKNGVRGVKNVGDVELLFAGTNESTSVRRRVKHERMKSMTNVGSTENSNLFQDDVSIMKPNHRPIKSMTDFGDGTHQYTTHHQSIPSLEELSRADNQV